MGSHATPWAPILAPHGYPGGGVLFGTFACAPCLAEAAIVRRLETRFPDAIRLVWKHFPQSATDELAAAAAAAANAQGGFWALYDRSTKRPAQALRYLSPTTARGDLLGDCRAAGLDASRIDRALQRDLFRRVVQHDVDEARRLQLAPGSALIDGLRVSPGLPFEGWERLIQDQLEVGRLERLRR